MPHPIASGLKTKVGFAIGMGAGTIIYDAMLLGAHDVDWIKVVFMMLFSFVIALILPDNWLRPVREKS